MAYTQRCLTAESNGSGSNVDRVLFKDLVEMVPLVESLMDKRASSSFARRASIVRTSAPLKKTADHRSKKVAQTSFIKETKDLEESVAQIDLNELHLLRKQISDLQKKLLEKEEVLKSTESLAAQANETYASIGDLKRQISEKDALIKSTTAQLYDAKIKLADKQAALEKVTWEVKMSKAKVEELESGAISNEVEISAMMSLLETLANCDSYSCREDVSFEPLPPLDEIKGIDIVKMEEAKEAYLLAVSAAKDNPSDEYLTVAAAQARKRLQSLL